MTTNNKLLIGLSGAAGSGKDFAAQVISQETGAEIVSFAAPVYKLASILFGVSVEDLSRRSTKETFFYVQVNNEDLIKAVDYLEYICAMTYVKDIDPRTELVEWLIFDLEKYISPLTLHPRDDVVQSYFISPRKILELVGTELGRIRVKESIWLDMVDFAYRKSKDGVVITDVRFPNEDDWVKESGGTRIGIEAPNSPYQIQSTHASASFVFKTDYTFINNYDDNFIEQIKNFCH